MKNKRMMSAAIAVLMAGSLAACGGSSAASTASSAATTDTAASGAASAGGQTLKVMLSEEPGEGDAFATTLNKWADETGNTVDIMVIPYDDQLTKFPLMAKNNDLPDLLSTTRLARLYPDEFEDLGQYIDTSIFEPQALQIISQNYLTDKLSVLPQQFTITNVFYNRTLLRLPASSARRWTTAGPWTRSMRLPRSCRTPALSSTAWPWMPPVPVMTT